MTDTHEDWEGDFVDEDERHEEFMASKEPGVYRLGEVDEHTDLGERGPHV